MFELILVGDGVVRLRRQPRVRIRDPLLPTAWRACARWPQALIDPGAPRRRQPEIEARAGTNPRAGGGSSWVQRARTECDRSYRRKGPAAAKSPRRMRIGRSKGRSSLFSQAVGRIRLGKTGAYIRRGNSFPRADSDAQPRRIFSMGRPPR